MTEQPAGQPGAPGNTRIGAPAGTDPSGRQASEVREAQEAHGGSMAPGLVDETGHQIAEPPGSTQSA